LGGHAIRTWLVQQGRRVQRLLLTAARNCWLAHSARTGVAAGVALAAARLYDMPEDYWAPITTLVVMQSTLGAAWAISRARLLGTALGVSLGALVATYCHPEIVMFGAALFVLGLICAILRLNHSAYRFAGIALAIVLLVTGEHDPWIKGAHRFLEVAIGIFVGLVFTVLWPLPELRSGGETNKGA
jgi:uncharacterized membrane protein YgaE (UPF0421/DUF939 family)